MYVYNKVMLDYVHLDIYMYVGIYKTFINCLIVYIKDRKLL